jgi:BlaI family penicillinase repressor
MAGPEGNLTPAQYEIMEAVWDRGSAGATVAEIWRTVSATRAVGRTTVLNLVGRLEKRGWLWRRRQQGASRYSATLDREKTATRLVGGFVDDFFGGSASNLVMSLLGSRRLKAGDLQRLRHLLESASTQRDRQKERQV